MTGMTGMVFMSVSVRVEVRLAHRDEGVLGRLVSLFSGRGDGAE